MIELKKKEESEKLKAMPIKLREEVIKYTTRLSGTLFVLFFFNLFVDGELTFFLFSRQ